MSDVRIVLIPSFLAAARLLLKKGRQGGFCGGKDAAYIPISSRKTASSALTPNRSRASW